MHLTLKKETTKPAAANFLQQQAKFDDFIDCFNKERPHQALGMDCPADRYQPSPRRYTGLPDLDYPFHDKAVIVTTCGRICYNRKKINLSIVFAGQTVGIKQVEDHIWLGSFMDYDLGYFDDETCRLRTTPKPLRAKSVTHVSDINRNLCVQNGPSEGWCPRTESNRRPSVYKTAALPAELQGHGAPVSIFGAPVKTKLRFRLLMDPPGRLAPPC